jgi:hypothetical protein
MLLCRLNLLLSFSLWLQMIYTVKLQEVYYVETGELVGRRQTTKNNLSF